MQERQRHSRQEPPTFTEYLKMTSRPEIRIYIGNGEFIDREMNDEEYAQWLKDKAESDAKKAAAAEAETKRQALLEKLGITEEEAKLLLA